MDGGTQVSDGQEGSLATKLGGTFVALTGAAAGITLISLVFGGMVKTGGSCGGGYSVPCPHGTTPALVGGLVGLVAFGYLGFRSLPPGPKALYLAWTGLFFGLAWPILAAGGIFGTVLFGGIGLLPLALVWQVRKTNGAQPKEPKPAKAPLSAGMLATSVMVQAVAVAGGIAGGVEVFRILTR